MKKFGIILFGLGLLLAQPVAAQNYAPALPDGGVVQYTLDNPGERVVASWNGVYVGPYEGTLLTIGGIGADPTSPAISLYCVDFQHYAIPNKVVTANVTNLGGGGGGDISLTRMGKMGTGNLATYQKAAFLSSLFESYASIGEFSGLSQRDAWSGIHAAIWSLTSLGTPYDGDANYLAFVAYANADYSGYDGYDQWSVLTTTGVAGHWSNDSQEFLVQTELSRTELSPTVTPEPQTYLLLASGLIFLVVFGRRRLTETGYA